MERLRINVSYPNGPEGRVLAVVSVYNPSAKAWIPETSVDDIGDSFTWGDVETAVDSLNPDGAAE